MVSHLWPLTWAGCCSTVPFCVMTIAEASAGTAGGGFPVAGGVDFAEAFG